MNSSSANEITTALIRDGLWNWLLDKQRYFIFNEFTFSNGKRPDVIAIGQEYAYKNSYNVIGFEIKLSRADFLRDIKWRLYLPYCTQFYFVSPPNIIKKKEIPRGIGHMIFDVEHFNAVAEPYIYIDKRASKSKIDRTAKDAIEYRMNRKMLLLQHAFQKKENRRIERDIKKRMDIRSKSF